MLVDDPYWLQRMISKAFGSTDADSSQKLAEEVFATLQVRPRRSRLCGAVGLSCPACCPCMRALLVFAGGVMRITTHAFSWPVLQGRAQRAVRLCRSMHWYGAAM